MECGNLDDPNRFAMLHGGGYGEDLMSEVDEEMAKFCFSGEVDVIPSADMFTFEEPETPNPFYDKVRVLRKLTPAFGGLMQEIKEIAEETKSWENGEFGEQYDVLKTFVGCVRQDIVPRVIDNVKKVLGTPETKPSAPVKPDRKTLYDRLSYDIQVDDIGTGVGACESMITRVTNNARFIDPGVKPVVTHPDRCVQERVRDVKLRDCLRTSFNALTLLEPDELEKVCDNNGLHVFPDVRYFYRHGHSKKEDDRFVYTDKKGNTWRDRIVDLGQPLVRGYKSLVTYRRTTVAVQSGRRATGQPTHRMDTMSKPGILNEADLGHKLDGEFRKMEWSGDQCVISDRKGCEWDTICRSDSDGTIYYEAVTTRKGRKRLFLLRVCEFEGFIPFHHSNALRAFCEKVDLRIDGVKLEAPPDYDVEKVEFHSGTKERPVNNLWRQDGDDAIPVDGVIARGDVDVYNKMTWTCDIKDVNKFIKTFGRNHEVQFAKEELQEADTVKEYAVSYHSGIHSFTRVRIREDKTDGNSDVQLGLLLDLATLI